MCRLEQSLGNELDMRGMASHPYFKINAQGHRWYCRTLGCGFIISTRGSSTFFTPSRFSLPCLHGSVNVFDVSVNYNTLRASGLRRLDLLCTRWKQRQQQQKQTTQHLRLAVKLNKIRRSKFSINSLMLFFSRNFCRVFLHADWFSGFSCREKRKMRWKVTTAEQPLCVNFNSVEPSFKVRFAINVIIKFLICIFH